MLSSTSKSSLYSSYEKVKKIGEGTFASVYLGIALPKRIKNATAVPAGGDSEDSKIKPKKAKSPVKAESHHPDVKVAIKAIKMGLFQDGLDMSAIREIKYLKELKHPNIIDLMDVVSIPDGGLHLILEFLDADLEMIIKNARVVFSGADIKAWMMMLFRGLNHCHANYILHRDLKPNNLLLAKDGTLKIADFGLARLYADPSVVMTSQVVTRWYRSPELLLGAKHYGGSVDMWSCGCIFAELMLRTPYFAAETDIGQLTVIFRARGTPTESDWPGMTLLPDYFEFPSYPANPSRSLFTAAGLDALDLLDLLLRYDPLKRPTALESLSHSYFSNMPRPTPNAKLPKDIPRPAKRKAEDHEDETESKLARKLF